MRIVALFLEDGSASTEAAVSRALSAGAVFDWTGVDGAILIYRDKGSGQAVIKRHLDSKAGGGIVVSMEVPVAP